MRKKRRACRELYYKKSDGKKENKIAGNPITSTRSGKK